MKESAAVEKPKKKISDRRKFASAPNIPLPNIRAKANDVFLETLECAREKHKESADTKKKPKQTKKAPSKKEVDKILMEAKVSNEEEEKSKDYQFAIKKNIVKIMNFAKKSTEKDGAAVNKLLQKSATEAVKKNPKKPKKKTPQEDPPHDDSRQKNLLKRAITATLPRRKRALPNQRPQSSFDHFPQIDRSIADLEPNATPMRPKPKSNVQKIKNMFRSFQEPSPKVGASRAMPKQTPISPHEELQAAETKGPIPRKKLLQRILPMPIGNDGPIEYVKPKSKKKPKADVKASQAAQKARGKGAEKKKKKKVSPEELLEQLINVAN